MALRILLADESATIKRVIELSLQDYNLELKVVNLGVDVLDVARRFQPALILLDILLQKKNGYEVCSELKNTADTRHIPVVMLWSGFMEIDPQKLRVVGADRSLEKPFDSDALRKILRELVPGVGDDNPLLQHLDVPNIAAPSDFTQVRSLDEIERRLAQNEDSLLGQNDPEHDLEDLPDLGLSAPSSQTATNQEDQGPQAGSKWSMSQFDDLPPLEFSEEEEVSEDESALELDDFSHFELKPVKLEGRKPVDSLIEFSEDDDNEWVNQSLGKFRLDLPEEDDEMEELAHLQVADDLELPEHTSEFLWRPEHEEASANSDAAQVDTETTPPKPDNFSSPVQLPTLDTASAAKHPSPEEIAAAEEIDLEHAEPDLEFESNSDLGIESVDEAIMPMPSSGHNPDTSLQQLLDSPEFQYLLRRLLEEKVQNMVEKALPSIAKDAIEKEIQRLLDEPF